jgi:signal transduction histidine kinase
VKFIAAIQREQVDRQPDELGTGPVARRGDTALTVRFEVVDSGPGIEANVRARLFSPFKGGVRRRRGQAAPGWVWPSPRATSNS